MESREDIRIGCVILAAGDSTRFGSNKLLAEIGGKTVIERAFDAVPVHELRAVAVVTQYDCIRELAERRGFRCIMNRRPEDGLSLSVRLGTKALADECDGIIYMVADQPMLGRGSVQGMIGVFRENPGSIVAMSSAGRRGNPCAFSKRFFGELCALEGDSGGRSVIEDHEDDLILFEAPRYELADVDTPQDMADIKNRIV